MTRKNPNRSKPSYVRQLGLEGAVKIGFGINVKGRLKPALALGMARKWVRQLAEKAVRNRVNRDNWLKRRLDRVGSARSVANVQRREFNDLVITMANKQRNWWARRTKYIGLYNKDIKALKKFITNNPYTPRKAA